MGLEANDYVPETEDELYDQRTTTLESLSNGDAESFEGSAIQSILQMDARVQAETVEQALDELYDASYVETANGANLDRKIRELGISRQPSVPATGVARFTRDSEPTTDYTIKSNLPITTVDGEVDFLTQSQNSLQFIEGFETSSLPNAYSGDTGSFSTQQSTVDDGSYALEAAATSGVDIFRTDVTVEKGDRLRTSLYLPSGADVDVRFGVEDVDDYYAARVDEGNGSLELIDSDGGTESTVSSTNLSVPNGEWITVVVDWFVTNDCELRLEDKNGNTIDSTEGPLDDVTSGGIGFGSRDANTTKQFDTVVTTATAATIEGAGGGTETNVGADRITAFVTQPTGVDAVTNPVPTGDSSYTDLENRSLVVGRDEETDEALRDRALSGQTGRGPTADGLETALVDENDAVVSATAFENEDTSTDGQNRPPLSVECVVYGGTDETVAQTLHDNFALTGRLTGGHVGTKATYTISDDFTSNDETYEWSRPSFTDLDVTVDLVVDGTYEGDAEIKERIVDYIGGTDANGTTIRGTLVGEDIRVDAIRDRLVGEDTGVRGIASITIDDNDDGNDDTTTDSNGLTVYSVGTATVARTDVSDGSVTVTTTQV